MTREASKYRILSPNSVHLTNDPEKYSTVILVKISTDLKRRKKKLSLFFCQKTTK